MTKTRRRWAAKKVPSQALSACTDANVTVIQGCCCAGECDHDVPSVCMARDEHALWLSATPRRGQDATVVALGTWPDVEELLEDIERQAGEHQKKWVSMIRAAVTALWNSEDRSRVVEPHSIN